LKVSTRLGLALFFGTTIACASTLDFGTMDKALHGDGLHGWMHGSEATGQLYVFTVRDPKDFFTHYEFPLVPHSPAIIEQLRKLGRHDEVLLKGELSPEGHPPQRHIEVTEVKLVKPYSDGLDLKRFELDPRLIDKLVKGHELVAKVHAVVAEGHGVVLDNQELVVPVYFKDNAQTKNLFRGDKIRLHYVIRKHPDEPVHLSPDPAVEKPVEVLSSILDVHGKPLTLEGFLVLFPKSPQINMDVYAIETVDSNGIALDYTLVNFEDADTFKKIQEKLKKAWTESFKSAERGRNKLINRKIRLRATGTGNEVDPGQANPQILLPSTHSIEFLK
jgi:hypothetical protein